MAKEIKCICGDSTDWKTQGSCDMWIETCGTKGILTVVDSNSCGCTEPLKIEIAYCPFCGRKLQEAMTDSREELLQELTTASNFLCDTALLFTHPSYEDTYPEWSGVYSVGAFLEEVVKQLESEVIADVTD